MKDVIGEGDGEDMLAEDVEIVYPLMKVGVVLGENVVEAVNSGYSQYIPQQGLVFINNRG